MNFKKGFTLIELLVVIAIIGLLSSVVLASLSTARAKAKDASMKAEFSQIRSQAELYYDGVGAQTYAPGAAATCTTGMHTDAQIAALLARINVDNGTGNVTCNVTTNAYAIQSPLASDATRFFCIDSSGTARETAAISVITDQKCD